MNTIYEIKFETLLRVQYLQSYHVFSILSTITGTEANLDLKHD